MSGSPSIEERKKEQNINRKIAVVCFSERAERSVGKIIHYRCVTTTLINSVHDSYKIDKQIINSKLCSLELCNDSLWSWSRLVWFLWMNERMVSVCEVQQQILWVMYHYLHQTQHPSILTQNSIFPWEGSSHHPSLLCLMVFSSFQTLQVFAAAQ